MRSDWIIGEWGKACGPSPSGGGAAGGSVTITSSGNELHMSGAGREYSTSECWEQFPGLSRISHSGGLRGWRSTCKTKPGDPRQATIVTTISATDNLISFDETGQYQFLIAGQNCTASVRRTRSLSLVQREGESAPVASATPTAPLPPAAAPAAPGPSATVPAAKVCTLPGPPVRLEVRPARKLLRPGDSFEFHATVLDAAGCTVPLSPLWKVVGEHASLELAGPGRIKIPESAAESTVELLATVAGHSARVTVEVASKDRYDALLAQKGLNAEGESSEAAVARIATSALGGGSVVTRDDSQRRRIVFVGVVGGTALVLGLLGFALVQHSRRKPLEPEPRTPRTRVSPAITPNHQPALAKVCPTCREEYPPDAAFCPHDGNRLVGARGNAEPTGPSGGVCPVCGQGYDPGVLLCPKHGEELLPAAMQASVRATDAMPTKKICPVCGKQYTGDSQFCGGCGAALVPVN
ncbi:MAG TPA: zinc ribbon domain-containing protein [Polyangiaceae bacterium]|nr:zinc ribbon domain-containing protein [Polyangiaceae bacterium]